ncbi:hypothetical protein D3C71_1406660 [compost metagenome]
MDHGDGCAFCTRRGHALCGHADRHLAPQGGRGGDPSARVLRPAHRSAQPPPHERPSAAQPGHLGALRCGRGTAVCGPGQLQGSERYTGPRVRRSALAPGGGPPGRLCAQRRHRGAAGGRRVCAADRGAEPTGPRSRRPGRNRGARGAARIGARLPAWGAHVPQLVQHRRGAVCRCAGLSGRTAQAGRHGHVPGQGCRAQHDAVL